MIHTSIRQWYCNTNKTALLRGLQPSPNNNNNNNRFVTKPFCHLRRWPSSSFGDRAFSSCLNGGGVDAVEMWIVEVYIYVGQTMYTLMKLAKVDLGARD